MTAARYGDLALYRRLARHALSSWLSITALFLIGLLATPLALLTPLPLKLAVDSVLGSRPLPHILDALLPAGLSRTPTLLLTLAAVLTILIAVLTQVQGLATRYLTAVAGERLVLDFRDRIFRQLQRLSLSYHDSTGTADSLYRIQNDAQAMRSLVIDGFMPSVSAFATLASMIYVMIRMDWRLTLVALAISPPILLVTQTYRARLRTQSGDVKKLESAALAVVHEVLGAIRVVKAFAQEDHETDRFMRRSMEGVRRRVQLAAAEGYFSVLVGLATGAGTAAVLFVGIAHVRSGLLSLGSLLLIMGYLTKLYDPVKTISRKVATVQGYLASIDRAFALLDHPVDVEERPDARPLARAIGKIEFRNVSFRYADARAVLHDISFEIEPGTRLGIVGASGAGKSTLINLLMRFYDPTSGSILLDGIDLRDYKVADLRRQFAVVQQEPVLFSTTIAENIAYGKEGVGRDEIVAAAQVANAHDFIIRFPRGYDTEVGERGLQLSGGQRQRISLARAFLQDSPVLILDEPTSAVDPESESAILRSMRRLMRGRTVLVITHRSSMLEDCTTLFGIENGRAVADVPSQSAIPAPSPAPAITTARRSNVMAHPAAEAWCQLHSNAEPLQVLPLKVRRQKNRIYRLEIAGRPAIVAKRCGRRGGLVEREVNEHILPRAAVSSLGYHGYVEEPDGEHCWIFMDLATGHSYSRLSRGHRAEAARWLGRLHSSVADVPVNGVLPDAGPGRYRDILQATCAFVSQHLTNPVLTADDVGGLEGLHAHLSDVATHWNRMDALCEGMPRTLVHGDFNAKNLLMRSDNGHSTVLVFDWEEAGWGIPAADLAQQSLLSNRLSVNPDLSTYYSTIRNRWPDASVATVQRLADCGSAFRALAGISWEVLNLAGDWAHTSVGALQTYVAELDDALERLGWSSQ